MEKKSCFISYAGNWGGRRGRQIYVQRPTPTLATRGARTFFFKDWRKGLHAKTEQSALTVIFKLAIRGLTSVILVVLGTVNIFSSRVHLFPFLWSQFSDLWQLMSWVQSGHHDFFIINFSTWGFSIYKIEEEKLKFYTTSCCSASITQLIPCSLDHVGHRVSESGDL